MEVWFKHFDNYNIIIVCVVLLLVCYCRIIGEAMLRHCISCEELLSTNFFRVVCGIEHDGFLHLVRGVLILYCFSLPMLFCFVHWYRAVDGRPQLTTFILSQIPDSEYTDCVQNTLQTDYLYENATSVWYIGNAPLVNMTHAIHDCLAEQRISSNRVLLFDLVFAMLPFAFAASVNCITWVNLTKTQHLNESTIWDENLHGSIFTYELSYIIECTLCNFAFLVTFGVSQTMTNLIYSLILFMIIEGFFIITAKTGERNDWMNNCIFVGAFFLLFAILLPTSFGVACGSEAQIALFVVFTLKITANVLMHFLVRGELGAGIVILCRLTCVCLSSCALLGFFIFTE